MGTRDPRVDAYIAKAAPFARPILTHLSDVIHEACPDVAETMKWSVPAFDYQGPMCQMAAFKEHCRFGFWKGALVFDGPPPGVDAAGQFVRLASVDDLPPKRELLTYVRAAAALNASGARPARPARAPKPELPVPDDLLALLEQHEAARLAFEGFSPSHRREYVEWIVEAKTEATRQRRLEQTLAQLADGKPRHWKHQRA